MKYPYSKGDLLIDRKTLKKFPIQDVIDGHIFLELGHKLVKRSIGQVMKHRKGFIHIKVGETLNQEIVFFCPVKNKMIVLEKGAVYLGEI